MKSKIIILLLLCSLTSFAQEKAKIVFQKKVIDTGTTIANKEPLIITNFVFYNKGKTPLVINKVKATCGCTVPTWPKGPIMPGKTGVIKVVFKTEGYKGVFAKTLFVESNAEEDITLLKIKGTID